MRIHLIPLHAEPGISAGKLGVLPGNGHVGDMGASDHPVVTSKTPGYREGFLQ